MRIYRFIALSVISASVSCSVLATEQRWVTSYLGGVFEYFIDKQDARLYIGCPTSDSSPDRMSSVFLLHVSTQREIENFTVTVNGHSYDGPIKSSSRVGSDNFKTFMQDIRKADMIVRYGATTVVYPKANAGKIIPPVDRQFPCNTLF